MATVLKCFSHIIRMQIAYCIATHSSSKILIQLDMSIQLMIPSNLSLPFTHPRFPSVAVLHAICALSSNYTNAVTSPPTPNLNGVSPGESISATSHFASWPVFSDEIFSMADRVKELRPDSFAERQANHAKELIDIMTTLGENILEALQGEHQFEWHTFHLNHILSSHHSQLVLLGTCQVSSSFAECLFIYWWHCIKMGRGDYFNISLQCFA